MAVSLGLFMGDTRGRSEEVKEESSEPNRQGRPNIVFILTDDHRWDALGVTGNELVNTPNLDRICVGGTRFTNAFVTLAICSPSRAACLTGRYGSVNGVTAVGKAGLRRGETTFAHLLRDSGYTTGVTGKWHLKDTPQDCGFDFASTCWANGTWYDRNFKIDGQSRKMPGFVDDVAANEAIRFMNQAAESEKPFMLWLCTQVPHMDHRFSWPAADRFLANHTPEEMPLPTTWQDDLAGKPEYLLASRNRTQALKYGYDRPSNIQRHKRDYLASVEQMDEAVGRVLTQITELGIREETWIIFMGDNGWLLGEHGMTSKVLPYEESMRVPLAISGPSAAPISGRSTDAQTVDQIVLNIDLTATILELAGLAVPESIHGRSLVPLVGGDQPSSWRQVFLYEAPTPQLGSKPLWAVRDARWKYVETSLENETVFRELYDLRSDSIEQTNLADEPEHQSLVIKMADELQSQRRSITDPKPGSSAERKPIPAQPPVPPRTDLQISGVYPHLTTYGVYSQNGAHHLPGHNECGIGAIVPWAGKLWMVNYAPHMPRGSEHKLYSIDADLSLPMTIHEESVGGTPAGRMIHSESNQLLIAHYLIDATGNVRTISPKTMPMRVTAIARHLTDPKNLVYYIDMEGSIWEANVHTLEVKRLFKKPVPGWHGKGGYTSQGRLVISNNGELHVGNYNDVLVGGEAKTDEDRGVLAEYDGRTWRIVERRQYTDVTGPRGIAGGSDGNDPLWAVGWDRRSLRLKLLDDGTWHTYLLPKASYCNDASHGWYTEWPRIREITEGRWLMDMHGMFFDFPMTFSAANTSGIQPVGSHLRYIPDFCGWNERLVLASDETSIQGNPLAGQPQSNLWFGEYRDLANWGPSNGYGGPWLEDEIKGGVPSDPYLVAGFDRRLLHLATGRKTKRESGALRATDQQPITSLPEHLEALVRVTVNRGDWHRPATGFSFHVSEPVRVFLAVDRRGKPKLPAGWNRNEMSLTWGKGFHDDVYVCDFPSGKIEIPANATEHRRGSFGMPHTAFVQSKGDRRAVVTPHGTASVTQPEQISETSRKDPQPPVRFTIQVDTDGTGSWVDHHSLTVPPNGYTSYMFPDDVEATWIRLVADRNCRATAFLHQTTERFIDGSAPENQKLFRGLADVSDANVYSALVYPAKRNRNLRVVSASDKDFEFTKAQFDFRRVAKDVQLSDRLEVEPEFQVDRASVVLTEGGRRFRLPKGDARFNQPFVSGWPRASREVQSERHLANIHGTFYEVPLITNGAPPAWNQMRPVATHAKQITDYCSWNGLLVLAGVRTKAATDEHCFVDAKQGIGLWFGGIDDLWKLGKPTGDGGPWMDSAVTRGVHSDPYLMAGYDRKTLRISHQSQQPVVFTLEVDLTGGGLWVKYREINVQPGLEETHEFPVGYSANWIRATADRDTTASVQLEYR